MPIIHRNPWRTGIVVLSAALTGCSTPGVRVQSRPVVGAVAAAADLGRLDRESTAVLQREGLRRDFRHEPEAVIRTLDAHWRGQLNDSRRLALARLCTAAAVNLAGDDPERALGLRLAAGELAWPLAIGPQTSEARRLGRLLHRESCVELTLAAFARIRAGEREFTIAGPLRAYRVRTDTVGPGRFDPADYDVMIPADRVSFRQLKTRRMQVDGLGGGFVAVRSASDEARRKVPLISDAGMAIPVNGLLDFGAGGGQVELVFRDLTLRRTVVAGGRGQPLTADFTAPHAVLVGNATVDFDIVGIRAMFEPLRFEETTGMIQNEPFRKGQIPVVLVHGLFSSPLVWLQIRTMLSADPLLEERYQFFFYAYPTGFSIVRNAATFRAHLQDMRAKLDPDGSRPEMGRMVLIGHSMGGILSNLQVRSSGPKFRKLVFDRPIDEMGLTAEQRRRFTEFAYFEANPDIRRVVFLASPHRGSRIASSVLGSLGKQLVRLPLSILTLGLSESGRLDGLTPFGEILMRSGSTSIHTLKPDNPVLATTLELPVRPGTDLHSIIGRVSESGGLERSSDGVVGYWSSHLDSAASEKVVRADHNDIMRNEEAIEELRRILYLHAGIPYGPPTAAGQ